MAMSISFIVPCYNIQPELLKRCLQSIIDACRMIEYEVIVVDDGSDKLDVQLLVSALNKSYIKCVRQENKGPGAARNTGLNYVSKEYVQFVDSDDYIFADNYRFILTLLEKESPELLVFGYKKVWDDFNGHTKDKPWRMRRYSTGAYYMSRKSIFCAPWDCVFSSKFADLRFLSDIYNEDEDYVPRLYVSAGRTIVTDCKAYAYYQRTDSTNNSIVKAKNEDIAKKRFSDLRRTIARLKDMAEIEPEKIKHTALQRRSHQLSAATVYELIINSPSAEFMSQEINKMASEECWPLPHSPYSWRYLLLSFMTDRLWKLKMIKKILGK